MVRKLLTAAFGGSLLLGAVSCGGSDSFTVEATPQGLTEVADRTAESATAAFTMAIRMEGIAGPGVPAGLEEIEIGGEGVFDTDAGLARLSLDFGSMFDALADQLGEQIPPGIDFDEPVELVMGESAFYMRGGIFDMLAGDDGKWLKIDDPELLDQALSAGGAGFGGATDPAALLGSLRGAAEVTDEGSEEIDGEETRHIHAEVSFADALEAAPDDQRAELEQLIEQMGDVTIPTDVFVNDDGYVRRVVMTFDFEELESPEVPSGSMVMTIDYDDFGEPVDIELPADDETVDGNQLLGG